MVVVYKYLIFVLMKKVHCPLFVNTWLDGAGGGNGAIIAQAYTKLQHFRKLNKSRVLGAHREDQATLSMQQMVLPSHQHRASYKLTVIPEDWGKCKQCLRHKENKIACQWTCWRLMEWCTCKFFNNRSSKKTMATKHNGTARLQQPTHSCGIAMPC